MRREPRRETAHNLDGVTSGSIPDLFQRQTKPLAMFLRRLFSRTFRPTRTRVVDPGHAHFRKLVRAHKLEFQVAGDICIEVKICAAPPWGLKTVHHEWGETASRLDHRIGYPQTVDRDGYYAE